MATALADLVPAMSKAGPDFEPRRQKMNKTGIGFAGIDGVWWLPASEAFSLPKEVARSLVEIGQALFIFLDVITEIYGTKAGETAGLNRLLEHKVPEQIPRLVSDSRVESLRPDFQLQPVWDREEERLTYRLVATELEICPSAHGFAHAMQAGYGLAPDLVESFARYLKGRELLFVGASQWSEFIIEQLAFCRALAEVGARGRVLYDLPVAEIARRINAGQLWQPPIFGVKEKPANWNNDLLGRIHRDGLEPFLFPHKTDWPEEVADAVVFRFGYFDCFSTGRLRRLLQWQNRGATLLNPTTFILDSKVVLAALRLGEIRSYISARNPETLPILDGCIPITQPLHEDFLPELSAHKDKWVVKFAGFDGGNQAWGGRSLQPGKNHTPESWQQLLQQYLALPWPVVAQQFTPSTQTDIAYIDAHGHARMMYNGHTRLRSFILRDPDSRSGSQPQAMVCGSHITVSSGTIQVSEATDAVQAPVVFQD